MWFELFQATDDDASGVDETSPDEALLVASQKDPKHFAILVARYQAPFLRRAQRVVFVREEAEDVVQEAFMKIYQYGDRFTPQEGASFRSWGYKILMNTALTRYQKLKRTRDFTQPLDPEYYELLADTDMRQFEKEEVKDLVIAALARLPDSMRRVLSQYYLKGLSQKEIAAEEETSVGAIKTRMHRAKNEFRDALKATIPL